MSIMVESDTVRKLPKLTSSEEFMNWRCRMYDFIRLEDLELICFRERPETDSAETNHRWMENMVRSKSKIILTLDSSPIDQASDIIVEDDRTEKDF